MQIMRSISMQGPEVNILELIYRTISQRFFTKDFCA